MFKWLIADRFSFPYLVMVSIGVLLFLFTACSVGVYSSRHSADAQSSLDSFKTHVHPLFTEMQCANCHISDEDAAGNGAAFADEDIAIAHTAALANQRVNFNDIESSKLVTRQQGAHNCNKPSGECEENANKLITALTKWQASRDSSAEESLIFTHEKDADQNKEEDYTNHELEFAINSLIGTAKGNVTLKVTASKSMRAKILTLKNFKISTTDDSIFLGGLLAKRNGMPSTDYSKKRVCALVEPGGDDKILTQFSEIVFSLADEDSSPNMIAFGLNNLRVATDNDECKNPK